MMLSDNSEEVLRILYVDDEQENLDSFHLNFMEDYHIFLGNSAVEGMQCIEDAHKRGEDIHVLICDQRMPKVTGVEFMEQVNEKYPEIVKILITGYTDIEVVTQAINKASIYRYENKPWDENELRKTFSSAYQHYKLAKENKELLVNLKKSNDELKVALTEVKELKNKYKEENLYLRQEINSNTNFKEIITESPKFKQSLNSIQQVAKTDSTVLILGETGTGKELVARAIHNLSNRKPMALVKVNCAALPHNLIESELFGHKKGAFTGAINRKIGRFELADKGTLFLDEIGEMPIEVQSKLLRALQEGEFERIGSAKTIKVDVRIVAATNRNLLEESQKGNFRSDLYFRLNVFPVDLPPLRKRREDIPLLAKHFVAKYSTKMGKSISVIPKSLIAQLEKYHWPGNVRELENIIERAVIISGGKELEFGDWLEDKPELTNANLEDNLLVSMEEMERQYIVKVLQFCHGKVSGKAGAAETLEMNPATLRSRMAKLGIKMGRNISDL